MPIRIRHTDGQVFELPPTARFVELTDLQGDIGHLIVIKEGGQMQMFSAKEDAAYCAKYAAAFKTKFCKVIKVDPRQLSPT